MREDQRFEINKYIRCYIYDRTYGMGQQRLRSARLVLSDLKPDPGESNLLLDVGCGRGEAMLIAASLGFSVHGCDPAAAAIPYTPYEIEDCLATKLSWPDKMFRVVTCFDVMEHLLPADVEVALQELQRVSARHIVIALSNIEAIGADGAILHITRKPYEEWDQIIRGVMYPEFDVLWRDDLSNAISETWVASRV